MSPKNSSQRPNGNNDDDSQAGKVIRSVLIWVVILVGVSLVYMFVHGASRQEFPVRYTDYIEFLNGNLIKNATITKSNLNDFEFHGELKESIVRTVEGRQ
ncbi:MAG: hypothetical protein ACKOAX_03855, partial [Candidatus Kapaibacterium sp.]